MDNFCRIEVYITETDLARLDALTRTREYGPMFAHEKPLSVEDLASGFLADKIEREYDEIFCNKDEPEWG